MRLEDFHRRRQLTIRPAHHSYTIVTGAKLFDAVRSFRSEQISAQTPDPGEIPERKECSRCYYHERFRLLLKLHQMNPSLFRMQSP